MKLGDLVLILTTYTGLKWLYEKINPDCGCERRKNKWNKIKLW